MKKQRYLKYLSNASNAVMTALLFLAPVSCQKKGALPKDTSNKKTILPINKLTMQDAFREGRITSINEYLDSLPDDSERIDTIVINQHNYKSRICLGAYFENPDSIHMHYFVPDTQDISPQLKNRIMWFVNHYNSSAIYGGRRAHEWKHFDTHHIVRDNFGRNPLLAKQISGIDICPEEFIKFKQHNEIISRIATVLQQRELYIKSGDLKVFDSFAKPYRDAVEQGIFTPGKMSPYKSELENQFIALTVSQWWIEHEQKSNIYVNRQKLAIWFSTGRKKRIQSNPYLYSSMLDLGYTFIKDGQLVNLNYFFNAIYYGKQIQTVTVDDIILKAQNAKDGQQPLYSQNPPLFGDVSPQPELLELLPILRYKEACRLDYEQKKTNDNTQPSQALSYTKYLER